MKNKKYNQKKRMTYETIKILEKFKDATKVINLFIALTFLLLIISLFVGATSLDGKFASLNNQATQQMTGAVYSYIPLISNITIGNYVFGIANKEVGTVFDISMCVGFILSVVGFILYFIPLKNNLKNLNKFKYLLSGILVFVGAIITFTTLLELDDVFAKLLYDMITYGKYDANKSETSAVTTTYSYILFVLSIISTIGILLKGVITLYREKNDANY